MRSGVPFFPWTDVTTTLIETVSGLLTPFEQIAVIFQIAKKFPSCVRSNACPPSPIFVKIGIKFEKVLQL